MKKTIIYIIGVIVMALGVALNYRCGFGSSSYNAMIKNISDILTISVGIISIVFNLFLVMIYFIFYRDKKIIYPIIATLTFGFILDFFNYILNFLNVDFIVFRIIYLLLANVIISLGVSIIMITGRPMTAYDGFVYLINKKILKKISYGVTRIIVESVICIIAILIGIIAFNGFGDVGIGTILITLTGGPICNLFINILRGDKNENIKEGTLPHSNDDCSTDSSTNNL